MLVIPAIDILDGEVVRLRRGDFALKKIYSSDPIAVAKQFEADGAKMIHVVDLNGAKTGIPANREEIQKIARAVSIPLEIGGGIRDAEGARMYLEVGKRIILGTKALEEPSLITSLVEEFGSERIVVALEIKGEKVALEGWQKTVDKTYKDFARELKTLGVSGILFTDIER